MNCYGVSVNLKNIPELDPEFTPLLKFNEAFLKDATKPVSKMCIRDRSHTTAVSFPSHTTSLFEKFICFGISMPPGKENMCRHTDPRSVFIL